MLDKHFGPEDFFSGPMLLLWVGIFGVIVIAAFIYPLVLSLRIGSLSLFKNNSDFKGKYGFRKGILTVQLIFTSGLIFFALIIKEQVDYLKDRDLGFQMKQTLVVDIPENSMTSTELYTLVQELKTSPHIKNSSLISEFSHPGANQSGYQLGWLYNENERIEANFNVYNVDTSFIDLMDITLLAGQRSQDIANNAVYVNEAFYKMSGFAHLQDLIGTPIFAFDDQYEIAGIVKDFSYETVQQRIKPLVIISDAFESPWNKKVLISLSGMKGIEEARLLFMRNGSNLFNYSFLDESVGAMYAHEAKIEKLAQGLSYLAIALAVLGLYSLSRLILDQRAKEIGIRKILGVGIWSITKLLSKEFTLLSLLALVIVLPVAWWQSDRWLSNFTYHVDVQFGLCLLTILLMGIVLTLGLLTNVIKGLMINPVGMLRE